ncbi:MAG: hypothetical protein V4673_13035 [Pseudomonadota bacterium]
MYKANFHPRNLAIVAVAAAALLSFASVAQQTSHAEDHSPTPRFLNGTFGFSLTQTCVRTPFLDPAIVGIDPATKQMRVDGEFVNVYGTGTMKFNRNGTVQIPNGFITEISAALTAANQSPVSVGGEFSCEGDYTIKPDGKLNVVLVCETPTPLPNVRVFIQPILLEGFVSPDRSITLGTYRRDIHSITVFTDGTPTLERERMCLSSFNFVKR